MKPELNQELHVGWHMCAVDPAHGNEAPLNGDPSWLPARVPGTVYSDLIREGHVPDPYSGMNEQQVQWVAERDWFYQLDFEVEMAGLSSHTDLVFEGLDTFAQVWLNGALLLRSDNMFVPTRVPVQQFLREGSNRLTIKFDSALRRGREQEALFGKRQLWNGDSSRLYVRKAQFHYGWDWGPVLLTAGPWQPIRLHSYALRIDEIESLVELQPDLHTASVRVRTRLVGELDRAGLDLTLEHCLLDPQGLEVARVAVAAHAASEINMAVPAPQLWWPAGHGGQALYRLVTRVLQGAQVLALSERRIGVRRLRLVQEPVEGESGTSFYFEVNGKALFTGGANWIPDDNLFERISPERYRRRIQQAVDANMLMLRVWAGGIYEAQAFYDTCDELGVLVWQDFLFACGMYPAHSAFQASVRAEAEAAVKRLRHHASLALWCGNNEDYAIAESVGQYGAGKDNAGFDARVIYETLLAQVCAALDPQRPYWPGSPYTPCDSGTVSSADPTTGDRHSWEVWHVHMAPYQDYHKVQARFVSEFGMQSHPSLALLEDTIPKEEQFAESRTMMWHNKAGSGFPDGHRRLAVYMADNLRVGPSLAEQVYATQFVQAEAMRYAYQDFRHRWQTAGARAVGGALVWQLNDCWPVTSWAVIDSAGVVKPAWHSIRRALASLALAVRIAESRVRAWVMSDRDVAVALRLDMQVFDLNGACVHQATVAKVAAPNASSDVEFVVPVSATPVLVQVRAYAADTGALLSVDTAWPEPFKFHSLPAAGITVQRDADGNTLVVQAQHPVKGLWLEASGLEFGDNFIDLVPGQVVRVSVRGSIDAAVKVSALDQAPLVFV